MQTRFARTGATLLLMGALAAGGIMLADRSASHAADESSSTAGGLVHNVYFSLKDSTPENRRELVAACHQYLSGEPGTVSFAVSTLADLDQPAAAASVASIRVDDRNFDVGLHIVFRDHAAHTAYQTAPRHEEFRSKYKSTWKQVRVFDSDIK